MDITEVLESLGFTEENKGQSDFYFSLKNGNHELKLHLFGDGDLRGELVEVKANE